MTRRTLGLVVALVLLQGAAVGLYLVVQRRREARPRAFAVERLRGDAAAPALELVRQDGSALDLGSVTGKPRLVHFWATWCPPCATELPGLLAFGRTLARSQGVELLAISVDRDWAAIRQFFPDGVPSEVVRSRSSDVHTRYGVTTLPDTYLVSADGRLLLRFGGARDWRNPAARGVVVRQLGR